MADENKTWISKLKRILDDLWECKEYFALFLTSLWGYYQIMFLLWIGCLGYFSWTQIVWDSIVVFFYLFFFLFGTLVRFVMLLEELNYKIIHAIIDVLSFIAIFVFLKLITDVGSEWMYMASMFVLWGMMWPPILIKYLYWKRDFKRIKTTFFVSIALCFYLTGLLAYNSPFRFDRFNVEGETYKIEYQNDKYIFWRSVSDSQEENVPISIFSVDAPEWAIISSKPKLNYLVYEKFMYDMRILYNFNTRWWIWWLFILLGLLLVVIQSFINHKRWKQMLDMKD